MEWQLAIKVGWGVLVIKGKEQHVCMLMRAPHAHPLQKQVGGEEVALLEAVTSATAGRLCTTQTTAHP